MKIDDLAYTAVERLAVFNLRIEACTTPENHHFEMAPAPMERFVYITSGGGSFNIEGGAISAVARDMVYLPRNTKYCSDWPCKSEFVVVDLSLCDADGNEIRFGDNPAILFHDRFCVYDGLLSELAAKEAECDPFNWLERTSLCLKLICEMARDTKNAEQGGKYLRIKDAITYIENNFAKDFPIDELAKISYLSPSAFRRIFFECKGMSPVDYRNTLRIRRAAELLKNGSHTVSEVAAKVGVFDEKYFGKLFSRYMGITPGNFRKENML